jgi:hypothetical protein
MQRRCGKVPAETAVDGGATGGTAGPDVAVEVHMDARNPRVDEVLRGANYF